MERRTFTGYGGEKGTFGSKVIEMYLDKEHGEIKTVAKILSKGAAGTRIYFVGGGYGLSTNYKVIEK